MSEKKSDLNEELLLWTALASCSRPIYQKPDNSKTTVGHFVSPDELEEETLYYDENKKFELP